MKLVRPTLLLDEVKCKKNIKHFAEKARKAQVKLRPHFKTHQSHAVGAWFRQAGINSCTVSSIKMAAYFVEHGWDDITVAFPLNFLEAEEINRMAKVCKLTLCIVSVDALKKLTEKLTQSVNCPRASAMAELRPAIEEFVSTRSLSIESRRVARSAIPDVGSSSAPRVPRSSVIDDCAS